MKLVITQDDIDEGSKRVRVHLLGAIDNCPVSIAATRLFGKPMFSGCGFIWDGQLYTDQFHSESLRVWQEVFDRGLSLYPGEFELESTLDPIKNRQIIDSLGTL